MHVYIYVCVYVLMFIYGLCSKLDHCMYSFISICIYTYKCRLYIRYIHIYIYQTYIHKHVGAWGKGGVRGREAGQTGGRGEGDEGVDGNVDVSWARVKVSSHMHQISQAAFAKLDRTT